MQHILLILGVIFQVTFIDLVSTTCSYRPYESGVSSSDIDWILHMHNGFRTDLAQGRVPNQPKATNMKRMYWDPNLAYEAQKIADTCDFAHVSVYDGRFQVGQNLYTTYSTQYTGGANWPEAIRELFKEHEQYQYPNGFSTATGHYTQIAWANTQYVGCGYTHYYSPDGYPYVKLYVCNYGPAGNYPSAPYETGYYGCENLC